MNLMSNFVKLSLILKFCNVSAEENRDGAVVHPSVAGQDSLRQKQVGSSRQRVDFAEVPEGLEGQKGGAAAQRRAEHEKARGSTRGNPQM